VAASPHTATHAPQEEKEDQIRKFSTTINAEQRSAIKKAETAACGDQQVNQKNHESSRRETVFRVFDESTRENTTTTYYER